MRSVAFGDYHNEMTMVRTRTKTKIMTMTKSYSEFPARPGSQVARLDFDIGAGLVEGQRFWHSRFSLIWTTCSLHTALEEQFNLQIRKMYIWRLEHGCERLYRNTSCSQTLWNEEMWSVPYKKKCHTEKSVLQKKVPYKKKVPFQRAILKFWGRAHMQKLFRRLTLCEVGRPLLLLLLPLLLLPLLLLLLLVSKSDTV